MNDELLYRQTGYSGSLPEMAGLFLRSAAARAMAWTNRASRAMWS
jgi:hypothetical protein